ncbi:MAG: glycosyltransferase [Chloroflexota bacterium]
MAPGGALEGASLMRVSLCMIVRNEEQCLARCLESARGVVHEIVVVDTGSGDSTPAIAASFGAVVLHHRWRDDFAEARNVALEHATGDWILVLDADEELEERSRTRIGELIRETDADGFQLRQRNLQPAGDLRRYEDLYITRLFRHVPEYRYEQPIHEQIRPSIERRGGKVVETGEITILHYGYVQRMAQGGETRALRNLRVLEAALARSPRDPYLHYQIGATHKALGNRDAAFTTLTRTLELDYESLGDPLLDKLYMKLAQLALGAESYPLAVDYSRASLERNPDNWTSLPLRGRHRPHVPRRPRGGPRLLQPDPPRGGGEHRRPGRAGCRDRLLPSGAQRAALRHGIAERRIDHHGHTDG